MSIYYGWMSFATFFFKQYIQKKVKLYKFNDACLNSFCDWTHVPNVTSMGRAWSMANVKSLLFGTSFVFHFFSSVVVVINIFIVYQLLRCSRTNKKMWSNCAHSTLFYVCIDCNDHISYQKPTLCCCRWWGKLQFFVGIHIYTLGVYWNCHAYLPLICTHSNSVYPHRKPAFNFYFNSQKMTTLPLVKIWHRVVVQLFFVRKCWISTRIW